MIARLVLQTLLLLAAMALILLLAAGDPSWPAAWAFWSRSACWAWRSGCGSPGATRPCWRGGCAMPWRSETAPGDRRRMIVLGVGFLLWLALMGVDARRLRLIVAPTATHGVGVLLVAASLAVTWWAFAANSFAATTVSLEPEQRVADTGPYALVRHPIYAGAILFFIGAPLMLGSWLGLLAAPLFVLAIGRRALAEEQLLRDESTRLRRVRRQGAPPLHSLPLVRRQAERLRRVSASCSPWRRRAARSSPMRKMAT